MAEQMSLVAACQDFFTKPPHSKRIEITEFKELTQQDKIDLREMLIAEGYDVRPLVTSV